MFKELFWYYKLDSYFYYHQLLLSNRPQAVLVGGSMAGLSHGISLKTLLSQQTALNALNYCNNTLGRTASEEI